MTGHVVTEREAPPSARWSRLLPVPTGLDSALVDAAAVIAAWAVALLAENAAVGLLWREQFLGPWEVSLARHSAVPLALAALAPIALAVSVAWRFALRASEGSRGACRAFAVAGALSAGALGVGISQGRHFANWGLRAPFVSAWVLVGAAAGAWLVPRVASLVRCPVWLGLLGIVLTISGWWIDQAWLPRLYPAFHLAMLAVSLMGSAWIALAGRAGASPPGRLAMSLAAAIGVVVVVCAGAAPWEQEALARATNLRIVLVEHAPMAGQAVVVAMALRRPVDERSAIASGSAPAAPAAVEVARSLDWNGHDLLLLSVDALRADHVSAYGYARHTTPNIDALAREGTLFESAYCPTPHTSYSLTSMMTGKYLRPLMALGLGADSETWAEDLRLYGWRTAAFYPPAVFFIDEKRFSQFESNHLGFEYAKVQFADPALREQQVREYLNRAKADRPLFLWVHFFEPHEPYVVHPDHVFTGGPSRDVDAYDSEVAEADDGIGTIVRLVRARRPGTIIAVTADHGEEFGEHGGRYHGTTVYEEQVRVPLIIVGPGVRQGAHVPTVVQTIDLLPTTLSALGIPRPARVRGRDLGLLLSANASANAKISDGGLAFSETDDYELLASGPDRLICERQAAACALYRPKVDPSELHDFGPEAPARLEALRALLRATERDHGRYEAAKTTTWPEAIRRGMQGEIDAAIDVASLLDDADAAMRRKAAEVTFMLHAPVTAPEVTRALGRDEDEAVRRWCALALVRMGKPPTPTAMSLLHDSNSDWRRRAALALGERGEPSACGELTAWWEDVVASTERSGADGEPPRLTTDLGTTRALLAATSKAACRASVPAILHALDDVRARPYAADALGALGDSRAGAPLLGCMASDPYVTTRPHEARALLTLGVRDWPSPLDPAPPTPEVRRDFTASRPLVVAVFLSDGSATLEATADGAPASPSDRSGGEGEVRLLDVQAVPGQARSPRLRLALRASIGDIRAIWLIPSGRLD